MVETDRLSNRNNMLAVTALLGIIGVAAVDAPRVTPSPAGSRPTPAAPAHNMFPTPAGTVALHAGLWDEPWAASGGVDVPVSTARRTSVGEVLKEHAIGEQQLLIMPVVVNARQSKDARETRIKRRHAVELALAANGYRMRFPDRMTYCRVRVPLSFTSKATVGSDVIVPTKLYRHEQGTHHVCILWVKDDLGKRPLNAIGQIIKSVIGELALSEIKLQSGLVVVGPAFSDTLTTMYAECQQECQDHSVFRDWRWGVRVVNVGCTSASLPADSALTLIEPAQQDRETTTNRVPVYHMTGRDDRLIHELQNELERRGLAAVGSKRIVLFVEQGSHEYIRHLVKVFDDRKWNTIVVPYLKGLRQDPPIGNSAAGSGPTSVSDYLERTMSRMRDQQRAQPRFFNDIVGVGVFGSDTLDRVAIIEAARERFPVATFFTTELDVRFTAGHAPECRNLLVASHFGLGLDGQLGRVVFDDLPTFRDAYQTSTFLGVTVIVQAMLQDKLQRKATEERFTSVPDEHARTQDLLNPWGINSQDKHALAPLIFEMGRQGAVQLTGNPLPDHFPIRQPPAAASTLGSVLAPILIIPLLVIGIGSGWHHYSGALAKTRRTWMQWGTNIASLASGAAVGMWRFATGTDRTATRDEASPPVSDADSDTVPSEGASDDDDPPKPPTLADCVWILLCTASLFFLVCLSYRDHVGTNREPVSLFDAVSLWPSITIQVVVAMIAGHIIVRSLNEVRPDGTAPSTEMTGRGHARRMVVQRGMLVASVLLLSVVIYMSFFGEFGIPPARSYATRVFAQTMQFASATLLIVLAALTATRIMAARAELAAARDECEAFDSGTFVSCYEKLQDAMTTGLEASWKLLSPAALTFLYAFARWPILDAWQIHPSSYFVIFAPLTLSVVGAFAMRVVARNLKYVSMRAIDRKLAETCGEDQPPAGTDGGTPADPGADTEAEAREKEQTVRNLKEYKSLIQDLNSGPFGPIANDPLLGGILLLVSATIAGPFRDVMLGVVTLFISR